MTNSVIMKVFLTHALIEKGHCKSKNKFNKSTAIMDNQNLLRTNFSVENNRTLDNSISALNTSSYTFSNQRSPLSVFNDSPDSLSKFSDDNVSSDENIYDQLIEDLTSNYSNHLSSKSTGGVKGFQNAVFSSALMKYCLETASQTSHNSNKIQKMKDSRYSQTLQLLQNKALGQTGNSSDPFADRFQKEYVIDNDGDHISSSEGESLYDCLSNAILQEYSDDELSLCEDFIENRFDECIAPVISGDMQIPNGLYDCTASLNSEGSNFKHSLGKEKSGPIISASVNSSKITLKVLESPLKQLKVLESPLKQFKDQVKVFRLRVKMAYYSHALSSRSPQSQIPSRLEVLLENIEASSSFSEVTSNVSQLSNIFAAEQTLANSFLFHFFIYVLSVIDLEDTLCSIRDFLTYMLPCVEIALKGQLESKLIDEMKEIDLLALIFNSLRKSISQETKFTHKTLNDVLEFKENSPIKAHIVRMQPTESQELFQKTFSDIGNVSDLYLIYIWRILKLYKIEGKVDEPVVTCLSETLDQSGKFIGIIPIKEVNDKESKDQFLHLKENSSQSCELGFEWVDFRIGQIYETGVVFLTNMNNWLYHIKDIATTIDSLQVKKSVNFALSLGTTFGLHLENGLKIMDKVEQVNYIRVRVVRLLGPSARIYGIDTGHICVIKISQLILLPASLINVPPCGRLAQLPIVPAPRCQMISSTLDLLVAITRQSNFSKNLSSIQVSPMRLLLQVPELTHSVLILLMALLRDSGDITYMSDICNLITDYLLRVTDRQTENRLCTNKALTILIRAMETSPNIRLLLAKEGSFVTLCELGLKVGDQQIWDVLRLLLGGESAMKSWLSVSEKISQVRSRKYFRPWHLDHKSLLGDQNSHDQSPAVIRIAAMPTLDRNWDLEVRSTLHRRQLVSCCEPSGWHWDKQEVLSTIIGDLHHGHKLDIRNDETHHVILDKSVPNIRMNTLLQVILGMLNAGSGGKIYIGLNNLGIVQGVRMTRDQRDCFMLGFSKLVTSEIFPLVFPCDSLVQFIPVIRPAFSFDTSQPANSKSTLINLEVGTFVVIITVRPQPNVLYRYRGDPEPVFMREGGVTSNIKGHRLSQLQEMVTTQSQHLQQQVSLEKQILLHHIFSNEAKNS